MKLVSKKDENQPTENNYVAIITLKNGDTLWPEKIEGNTKDVNAVITLSGHFKDGEPWEVEIERSRIDVIKKTGENAVPKL